MADQTAVFDLDGVVANTYPLFETWARQHFGINCDDPAFEYRSITASGKEAVFDFFTKPEYQFYPLIKDARRSLRVLKSLGWRLICCTSRDPRIHTATFLYVAYRRLPFDELILQSRDQTKLDIAASRKAQVLIDDEVRHLMQTGHQDILRILFEASDAPSTFIRKKNKHAAEQNILWFQSKCIPQIYRARNWSELLGLLSGVIEFYPSRLVRYEELVS